MESDWLDSSSFIKGQALGTISKVQFKEFCPPVKTSCPAENIMQPLNLLFINTDNQVKSKLKGEGHSKNCIVFVITNKNLAISLATHQSFSFY